MRKITAVLLVLCALLAGCNDSGRKVTGKAVIDGKYIIFCRTGFHKDANGKTVADIERQVASKKEYDAAEEGDKC